MVLWSSINNNFQIEILIQTGKNIFLILEKSERRRLVKLILLDVIVSVLDVSFLAILLYVIHFYTTIPRPVYASPFTILNDHPLWLIICFLILFGIKNLFGFLVFRSQFRFVYTVASRLSGKNLSGYLNGTYKDYVDIDMAVHIRKISHQPIEFCHYVLAGFQQIISQSILITITIIAILIFKPALFPLLFIVLTPPIILTGFLLKRKVNAIRRSVKVTGERSLQHLHESISSFIESNVYDKKNFFIKRYFKFQSRFNDLLADQHVILNMPSRLIEVFAVLGLFILIVINSYAFNSNSVQVLVIGAFMAAAYKIIPGIVKILNNLGQIKTYGFTMDGLLKAKSFTKIKEQGTHKITSAGFLNVSFGYKEEKLISGFSAEMQAGDFVGISGLSGKGKTTLINLLLGFLKPVSGTVIINDDVKDDEAIQQYWNRMSYVKQQPFFIHDSILKNIILDDNYDHKKLSEIISVTGLDEVINNFADRVEALVTENGKNLSGGQRQRVALARALYKDFDLIILDEPFSELDAEAEERLLDYFRKISREGKIVLLITHNKRAFSFCNKTISLE